MKREQEGVFVAGCGKSGLAAAALFLDKGAAVLLYDKDKDLEESEIREKVASMQKNNGVGKLDICLGDDLPEKFPKGFFLAILSPGIPVDLPFVEELKKAEVPIWGEIELAYRMGRGRVIGITGTNGKTTTTTLVGDMMKDYFENVVVVGNIGNPYTLEAPDLKDDSVVVAEISSFQLETTETFHPVVTAILNITPDHLNRHHTFENYIKIKQSITKNQTKDEICVLNYDDELTRKMAEDIPAKPFFFSRLAMLENGICLDGDEIVLRTNGESEVLFNRKELLILGDHNVENAMAALAIGLSMGVPKESMAHTLRNFHAVEHRIEFVASRRGVLYYNDSKATNVDAAIKGIKAMTTKTVLIGGGYNKGAVYDEWFKAFDGKVKALVLMGETSEVIAKTAKRFGIEDVSFADDIEAAVMLGALKASPGEAVLLSPACASWDMFESYEERGNLYKNFIIEMEE